MTEASVSVSRRRILFMAEAVTLAHVARPHVLANSLSADVYDVLVAVDPRYNNLFSDAVYQRRNVSSVSSDCFMKALARGAPIYNFPTLRGYVEEDLRVIDQFQPDVIVGD